jgi:hypothetical protein
MPFEKELEELKRGLFFVARPSAGRNQALKLGQGTWQTKTMFFLKSSEEDGIREEHYRSRTQTSNV